MHICILLGGIIFLLFFFNWNFYWDHCRLLRSEDNTRLWEIIQRDLMHSLPGFPKGNILQNYSTISQLVHQLWNNPLIVLSLPKFYLYSFVCVCVCVCVEVCVWLCTVVSPVLGWDLTPWLRYRTVPSLWGSHELTFYTFITIFSSLPGFIFCVLCTLGIYKESMKGLPWWSRGEGSELMQRVWVQSLVRELGLTCCN